MSTALGVKICGVTTVEDARAAARLGADLLGLNFYPASPRCISQDTAVAILSALPDRVEAVAVVVNEALDAVARRFGALARLRIVQFHGDNPEMVVPSLFQQIVAFRVRDERSLHGIDEYLKRCRDQGALPRAILVDAYEAGLHGGTGRTVPWDVLDRFRPEVPLILAGGLTPENVAEAVRRVRPQAVDVASGVEASPGRKDSEKMRRFIQEAREAADRAGYLRQSGA